MRSLVCTLFCISLMLPALGPAQAQPVFRLERAFPESGGFQQPVDIQHAGDGTERLFIVEQGGQIRFFEDREDPNAETFLRIRERVRAVGELGMLGLAFHPDYATNGFFYVYYNARDPLRSVVSRFSVDPSDPNLADPESEVVILEVEQPFANHNGGQIAFGPDGMLYIALGDGGDGGDPLGHGQNRQTLLGSILRIDVDNPDADKNYGIPADNPFVGNTSGFREEIYAYGLRNPWRFSFDAETGDLWTGDVGQGQYEEINRIERGGNYGWNTMEGFHCFAPPSGCETDGLAMPVFEYAHNNRSKSVTGGYVYRGSGAPSLVGKYIYADFITGEIWALTADDGVAVENVLLFDTELPIATFGVDAAQELYIGAFDGRIYTITEETDTAVDDTPEGLPARLLPGHPNPFRETTTLMLTLDRAAYVEVALYDLRGRHLRTLAGERRSAGTYPLVWDGRDAQGDAVAPGVYLARLLVEGTPATTHRLVRVR